MNTVLEACKEVADKFPIGSTYKDKYIISEITIDEAATDNDEACISVYVRTPTFLCKENDRRLRVMVYQKHTGRSIWDFSRTVEETDKILDNLTEEEAKDMGIELIPKEQ